MTRTTTGFEYGERKPPTKKHRPAIWEAMLGTVYAADPDGNVRYFDYDYAAAKRFARVRRGRNDLRLYRHKAFVTPYLRSQSAERPRDGQLVLWRKVS